MIQHSSEQMFNCVYLCRFSEICWKNMTEGTKKGAKRTWGACKKDAVDFQGLGFSLAHVVLHVSRSGQLSTIDASLPGRHR